MPGGDGDDGIVCWVTAEGNVICENVLESAECTSLAMFVAGSESKASARAKKPAAKGAPKLPNLPDGEWGPNKIELACRLLEVLGASNLPDEKIPRRSGEIVDSVKKLLDPVPPSILLFNYSTLPANVMGAYYMNKADLVNMQRMYELFKNPKQP